MKTLASLSERLLRPLPLWLKDTMTGTFRTYSICLFSMKNSVAFLILASTFVYPAEGATTLLALFALNLLAVLLKLDRASIKAGYFTVSPLFLYLALLGTYDINAKLLFLMMLGGLMAVFITISVQGLLSRFTLPALSLPFILTFWLIYLSTKSLPNLELSSDRIYYNDTILGFGGFNLLDFYLWMGNLELPAPVREYLTSLGAIFLQFNILSGAVVALALLIQSRITFLMSICGFAIGYSFYLYFIGDLSSIYYGYIGYNFILVSIAMGGYFFIANRWLFLLLPVIIPMTGLISASLYELTAEAGLPLFSLPYILTVYIFLYGFPQTAHSGWLVPVGIFRLSPEKSLYHHLAEGAANRASGMMAISPPFFGTWRVTQDENGKYTHKGDWRYAWDFMVYRNEKTWKDPGKKLTDFHSYGLPVLAAADGTVVDVSSDVPDNPVGEVNIRQNWGNSVVICHAEGLYTQISHLKQGSINCKIGDYVKRGQQLAQLGNSGRSPEPHIHFQIQATPAIGSATVRFPLKNYVSERGGEKVFMPFGFPKEGDEISNPEINTMLMNAFRLRPGRILRWFVETDGPDEREIEWEIHTDAYNLTYIYCRETASCAYFSEDGSTFRFHTYYGSHHSPLFEFFRICFKVAFVSTSDLVLRERIPLSYDRSGLLTPLRDFLAPFIQFLSLDFESRMVGMDHPLVPTRISFVNKILRSGAGKKKVLSEAEIFVNNAGIDRIEFSSPGKPWKLINKTII